LWQKPGAAFAEGRADPVFAAKAKAALGEIRDLHMQSRAWTLYEPGEELLRHIRQQEEEQLRPVPSQCMKRDDMERITVADSDFGQK